MYTIEERIDIVAARLRGQSYEEVRNRFQRKPAPSRGKIQILVNKFMRTGSVAEEPRTDDKQYLSKTWRLSKMRLSVVHMHPLVQSRPGNPTIISQEGASVYSEETSISSASGP